MLNRVTFRTRSNDGRESWSREAKTALSTDDRTVLLELPDMPTWLGAYAQIVVRSPQADVPVGSFFPKMTSFHLGQRGEEYVVALFRTAAERRAFFLALRSEPLIGRRRLRVRGD